MYMLSKFSWLTNIMPLKLVLDNQASSYASVSELDGFRLIKAQDYKTFFMLQSA